MWYQNIQENFKFTGFKSLICSVMLFNKFINIWEFCSFKQMKPFKNKGNILHFDACGSLLSSRLWLTLLVPYPITYKTEILFHYGGPCDSGEAGPLPSPGVNTDKSKPKAIIPFPLPVIGSGKEGQWCFDQRLKWRNLLGGFQEG